MSNQDKLLDCPFDFHESKSGMIQISYKGKTVTYLKGQQAKKFSLRASMIDEQGQQLLMAKATGHFKHGNEKMSK
jgi:hypothetical protein